MLGIAASHTPLSRRAAPHRMRRFVQTGVSPTFQFNAGCFFPDPERVRGDGNPLSETASSPRFSAASAIRFEIPCSIALPRSVPHRASFRPRLLLLLAVASRSFCARIHNFRLDRKTDVFFGLFLGSRSGRVFPTESILIRSLGHNRYAVFSPDLSRIPGQARPVFGSLLRHRVSWISSCTPITASCPGEMLGQSGRLLRSRRFEETVRVI